MPSDVGTGAFQSQWSPKDKKFDSCDFLVHRLSPGKTEYEVRDCELLAVNVDFVGWQH